jgi:ribonuclease-3 family protein
MKAFPGLPDRDAARAAPLVLAYIGDTVYDLYIRTMLIHSTDLKAHGLHMKAIGLVRASAQAAAFRKAEPMLSEEEISVYKRGRNANIHTVPKHAELADYRAATGFEALIGYLYLCGRDERIASIISFALPDSEPLK